ncbi:hypothetical protein PPMP20_17955 [Paraburkholderia phymatum]|uniref:Uncharacterized protein n=1 Tax=Paraburkholderia phymatum (strain DSM 17167 / CIP 108236 / LMG 21445 / STM815) TaxID=391038 RepID=B2JTQ1_PARP8|nr:hypothetical protein [Paraburkholderia phymatum]ACC75954.1 conserved hypothetical protein [Paraburkholderia phymatum STM815]
MKSEEYRGYTLWGHAILNQREETTARERYAASGTITKEGKIVEASGVLNNFDTEDEAELAGLLWGRAWVESQ